MQNLVVNFESLSQEEFTKYSGKWVAVINGKVVAHGENLKKLLEDCKKQFPKEKPLVGKLPEALPLVLSVY